jgi:hypothetical protein
MNQPTSTTSPYNLIYLRGAYTIQLFLNAYLIIYGCEKKMEKPFEKNKLLFELNRIEEENLLIDIVSIVFNIQLLMQAGESLTPLLLLLRTSRIYLFKISESI